MNQERDRELALTVYHRATAYNDAVKAAEREGLEVRADLLHAGTVSQPEHQLLTVTVLRPIQPEGAHAAGPF